LSQNGCFFVAQTYFFWSASQNSHEVITFFLKVLKWPGVLHGNQSDSSGGEMLRKSQVYSVLLIIGAAAVVGALGSKSSSYLVSAAWSEVIRSQGQQTMAAPLKRPPFRASGPKNFFWVTSAVCQQWSGKKMEFFYPLLWP
jgi:hypothetical protein